MVNTPSIISAAQNSTWLSGLGFRFDPFQHIEASSDSHLGDYVVGHKTFAVAWDEAPALILSPAGGGKTCMRIYTTRACWVGQGGYHPFPISYFIPAFFLDGHSVPLEQHEGKLAQAGATSLLIGLAFRPERFLTLSAAVQRQVVVFLQNALVSPLSRYLDILRASGSPLDIVPLLDRTYLIAQPPPPKTVRELCAAMESTAPVCSMPRPPRYLLTEHIELLLGPLEFRSVFVLIDGIDAFPDTGSDSAKAIDMVLPILLRAESWAQQRVYLKGFLPLETNTLLPGCLGETISTFRQAQINWTVELLAEVIRKRVYAASGGEFSSLDAISSPDLRGVDTLLAEAVHPLPREIIVLVQRVLAEYDRRVGGRTGKVETTDIEKALAWYRAGEARLAQFVRTS